MKHRQKRLTEIAFILFILTIGLRVRLYKINNPIADWHSWRQADTAAVSRNYLKSGIDLLHPKFDDISDIPSGKDNPEGYRFVEFPISNALHAILAKLFSKSSFELIGRLLSVSYSLISIVLLYYLVKLHIDQKTAILATTIFTLLPFNIYYSRVILTEPLLITSSLAFLLFFSKWIKAPGKVNFSTALISLALLLLLKAYMAVFAFPALYLAYQKFGSTFYKRKEIIFFFLFSFLPFLLWFIWARQFPEGIPHFKWAFNGDNIRFRPSFFYWIFSIRFGTLILGIWGVALFVRGLITGLRQKMNFFLFWLLGIFVYVSIIATANVRHDYYQAIASSIFAIYVAIGFLNLWKEEGIAKVIPIFCLAMMFLTGWQNIKGYYQINHPEIILAGQFVNTHLPLSAKVIAPYDGDTAFLYQTNRKGWPYVTLPIKELIAKGATHFVSVNYNDQTNEFMQKFTIIEKNPSFIVLDLTKPLPSFSNR